MMNKITLDNHYKNLIGKKRFWNLSLIVLIFIGVILSSKIIDINGSNLLNGMPRLGDYISQILPSIEISDESPGVGATFLKAGSHGRPATLSNSAGGLTFPSQFRL